MSGSNLVLLKQPDLVDITRTQNNFPPPKQKDQRDRFYITESEVNQVLYACKLFVRHRVRNKALIMMLYRHGLRTCEAIAMNWNLIDFKNAKIHVRRAKNGSDSVQPICGPLLRMLRQLKREYAHTPYIFNSERLSPLAPRTVRSIIANAGRFAELHFLLRPHMLRHGCGFYLANQGVDTRTIQDYLGHKNIHHTVRYTKLGANRFNGLWRD